MRGSRFAGGVAIAVIVIQGGCSSDRNLVAVDPYPCGDGDPTACAPGLLDDLIGFWRLNDAAGSPTAHDWSGRGNNGTLVGIDPATAWVAFGPEGGALSVEGTGYVNVPRSASIDSVSTQVTLAAWMYLDGTIDSGSYATAISRQIGTGFEQHYHLSINSKRQAILFITTPASGQVVLGGPMNVPQQTWVHLAGTYDGTEAHLYVDGREATAPAPVSGAFAAETNPVILSGNGNGAAQTVSETVPGLLDEVMLYRRALSADDIARIHNGALLAPPGSPADAGSP